MQGRPKKTAEELDAEMDNYWGAGNASDGQAATTLDAGEAHVATASGTGKGATGTTSALDDDIDIMVE